MNLEQIATLTISNVQMLLDSQKVPLAVGPINEEDYKLLISGYSELEWEHGFCRYGNRGDKFEFCLKLLSGPLKHLPAGASLCTFDESTGVIDIHFVESFVREDKEHPLYGRMFSITLSAVYLFGSAVGCNEVRISDTVNRKVMEHYQQYGFTGDVNLLSAPFATIGNTVRSYIKPTR